MCQRQLLYVRRADELTRQQLKERFGVGPCHMLGMGSLRRKMFEETQMLRILRVRSLIKRDAARLFQSER
jgi:hypothetical protein